MRSVLLPPSSCGLSSFLSYLFFFLLHFILCCIFVGSGHLVWLHMRDPLIAWVSPGAACMDRAGGCAFLLCGMKPSSENEHSSKRAAHEGPILWGILKSKIVTAKEGKSATNLGNLGKLCQIWPRAIYLCWAGWRSRKLYMLGRLAVPKTLQILGKILT